MLALAALLALAPTRPTPAQAPERHPVPIQHDPLESLDDHPLFDLSSPSFLRRGNQTGNLHFLPSLGHASIDWSGWKPCADPIDPRFTLAFPEQWVRQPLEASFTIEAGAFVGQELLLLAGTAEEGGTVLEKRALSWPQDPSSRPSDVVQPRIEPGVVLTAFRDESFARIRQIVPVRRQHGPPASVLLLLESGDLWDVRLDHGWMTPIASAEHVRGTLGRIPLLADLDSKELAVRDDPEQGYAYRLDRPVSFCGYGRRCTRVLVLRDRDRDGRLEGWSAIAPCAEAPPHTCR